MRIQIGSSTFTATLFDNATATAFKGMLPMTIKMRELNGNEKHFDFYQLRSHYIVYRTIKCLFNGSNIAISSPEGRHSLEVLIPFSVYSAAMDFSGEEDNRTLLHHAMSGLAQEDLIEKQGTWNGGLVAYSIQPESEDISVTPSVRGVELFLAAYGFGHFGVDCFLSSECVINDFAGISIPEGGRKGRT